MEKINLRAGVGMDHQYFIPNGFVGLDESFVLGVGFEFKVYRLLTPINASCLAGQRRRPDLFPQRNGWLGTKSFPCPIKKALAFKAKALIK
jgi:hypothetical protein